MKSLQAKDEGERRLYGSHLAFSCAWRELERQTTALWSIVVVLVGAIIAIAIALI